MPDCAIYQLDPIVDNPAFEGFAFTRGTSIRNKSIGWQSRLTWDFLPDDVLSAGRNWSITPMSPFWTPQEVIGKVKPHNDFPCVNLTLPAFSKRAVDVLLDYLEPNGELLPLASSLGDYYVYNITTKADILNLEKSSIIWSNTNKSTVIDILRYEFIASKTDGLTIFRLVEDPAPSYVTQAFVDRAQAGGLQGLHFVKLWPLEEGANWRDIDRKARSKFNRDFKRLSKKNPDQTSAPNDN